MSHITFDIQIDADIDRVFAVSTDYANLDSVTNGFYTRAKIRSTRENSTLVAHRITILENTLAVMIKHVVEKPYVHKSYWVGGDAKGSVMTERYEKSNNSTILHVDAMLKIPFKISLKSTFSSKRPKDDVRKMANGIAKASTT